MKSAFCLLFLFLLSCSFARAQSTSLPGQMSHENTTEYNIRMGEQMRMERERNEASANRPVVPQRANYVNRWPGAIPLMLSKKKRNQWRADKEAIRHAKEDRKRLR